MDKRWQLSFDGGTTYADCNPLNGGSLSIDSKRDLSKGQVFYRKSLSGPIKFGKPDYDNINEWRLQPPLRCGAILVRLQLRCGGIWQTEWTGEFSPSSGKWDIGRCTFEAKASPVDRYSCLLAVSKVKRNILQVAPVQNLTKLLPSVEFLPCKYYVEGEGLCEEIGNDPEDPLLINGWEYINDFVTDLDGNVTTYNLYWREKVTTECVGGLPVVPPGLNWQLYENNCDTTGFATYVRRPLVFYPFGDPGQGTFDENGNPVAPDNDCNWFYIGNVSLNPQSTGPSPTAPYFICLDQPSDFDTEFNRGRLMKDVTEFILDRTECSFTGVRSDFFEWNPTGSAPNYIAGYNYVTGNVNQVDELLIFQKTDVINPLATNPATIGELTFEELMQVYRVMFQVYWDIDDEGYLRLEHWKYWDFALGLDTTASEGSSEKLIYSGLTDDIPQAERATWMEAVSRDFVGLDIEYSGPCVSDDKEAEDYSPGKITTEVTFVVSDPDSISREGFVIMATALSDGVYNTIIDIGAITENFITNAPLSWANLQRDYWTWNRKLREGKMNGVEQVFDGFMPNIEQDQFSVVMCCPLLAFNAQSRVKTELSSGLGGVYAIVESSSFSVKTNRLSLTLRYSY